MFLPPQDPWDGSCCRWQLLHVAVVPGGYYPRWQLSWMEVVLGGIVLRGSFLNGNCPRWKLSWVTVVLGGSCLRWQLS